jgi:hypothetical protein
MPEDVFDVLLHIARAGQRDALDRDWLSGLLALSA